MRKLVLFFLVLALCKSKSQTLTPNQEWRVLSSTIKFKVKNAGFTVDGTFGELVAKVNFDPAKNYGNVIEASIDAKTINTGNTTRDGHLKKEEYFNVLKYSKIIMKATVFSKQADGSFKGYFSLTIKDKSKDIVVPFNFTEKDGKGVFKASFAINRLDFEVGSSSVILSNNVTVMLEVNVIKR